MMRAVAFCLMLSIASIGLAADAFKKLNGQQVRSRLAGMEITDGVHWAELYNKDGSLTQWAMGRKYVGTWTLQGDELCTSIPKRETQCREVWIGAGNKIEFRTPGIDLAVDGRLIKQQPRP